MAGACAVSIVDCGAGIEEREAPPSLLGFQPCPVIRGFGLLPIPCAGSMPRPHDRSTGRVLPEACIASPSCAVRFLIGSDRIRSPSSVSRAIKGSLGFVAPMVQGTPRWGRSRGRIHGRREHIPPHMLLWPLPEAARCRGGISHDLYVLAGFLAYSSPEEGVGEAACRVSGAQNRLSWRNCLRASVISSG